MNDAKSALLDSPGVREVHMDASTGRFEVEHELADPSVLTAIIGTLHGWEVAINGEVELVQASSTIDEPCQTHG
jgi:hypothetical protein